MKIENIKYSWTKYGASQSGTESRTQDWNCQVCGESQPYGIDPFLFEFRPKEYIRICLMCEHVRFVNDIVGHFDLIMHRRRPHGYIDNVLPDEIDFLHGEDPLFKIKTI